MINITCPKCGAVAKLSFVDADYTGPRRCWKCHEYFTISIRNNQLVSCEPLSVEEYEAQQAAKEAEKAGGIMRKPAAPPPPKQAAMDFAPAGTGNVFDSAPQTSHGGIEFNAAKAEQSAAAKASDAQYADIFSVIGKKTPSAAAPEPLAPAPKRDAPQYPPEKPRDFSVPLNAKPAAPRPEPVSPSGVFPPERFQTFVPMPETADEPEKPAKEKKAAAKPKESSGLGNWSSSSGSVEQQDNGVFPPERFRTFVPFEKADDDNAGK